MTETIVQADPVTKVARDLTEILRLHQALLTQAVNHGGAPHIPGGESMVALGNVANVEAWDNQHQATERHDHGLSNYRRAYTSVEDEDPDEAWSAYQLIEFWSEAWRTERGDDYDSKRTLRTEANYVRHALDWAWDNEIHFNDFAADMRRARLRLEDIVYDGKRVERTRVVCDKPDCPNPRRLIKLHAIYDPTGIFDTYKCPECKAKFDQDEFDRAYAAMLKSEGAERFVSQAEALATLKAQGRGLRTVRRWMAPQVREVDRCAECGREYERQEWNVCPRKFQRKQAGVVVEEWTCGGELEQAWTGDREAVVLGYCELGTHQVMLWWPDLWTKHLATRQARVVARSA
jgi:DNA-directed RNA polymerase subunit RPC12/RpoP